MWIKWKVVSLQDFPVVYCIYLLNPCYASIAVEAATLSVNPENTCTTPDGLENDKLITTGSGDVKERSCDSLVMCIVTTLNQGLRNGGGIGDILRAPSSKVNYNWNTNLKFQIDKNIKIIMPAMGI